MGLRKAILRYGGTPSERPGDFAEKVTALENEGPAISSGPTGGIERFLDALSREIERSQSAEGETFLEEALDVLARTDPEFMADDSTLGLENALAYGHSALNALLHRYRMPAHDAGAFGGFFDVTEVPFREVM